MWPQKCTEYFNAKAQATTVAPTNKTTNKTKKAVTVEKALGPGSNLGLKFTIDVMKCAWLKRSFEGFKV